MRPVLHLTRPVFPPWLACVPASVEMEAAQDRPGQRDGDHRLQAAKGARIMEITTFDDLSRNFGSTLTRRSALRGLVASAAAVVAGGALLTTEDALAKKRRRKQKNRKKNTRGPVLT